MELLIQLWLPTLLSAIAVWILAAIAHTVLPHHNTDMRPLPNEDAFLNAIRPLNIPTGNYMVPFATHKSASQPDIKAKFERGPVGTVSIWPPKINIARSMILSFLVYLAVSFLIAYLGSMTLPAGTGFSKAFQVLGTAGVLAYCFAHLPGGIWFQAYNRAMINNIIDGLFFGLTTGAIFAAMWPNITP